MKSLFDKISIVLFSFSLFLNLPSFGQSSKLFQFLNEGNYNVVITESNAQLKTIKDDSTSALYYYFLTQAYLNLGNQTELLSVIHKAKKHNPNKKVGEVLYNAGLAEYYHALLFTDSSTYFANQALFILRANMAVMDSTTISYVYTVYANCMRNGGAYLNFNNDVAFDFRKRNEILKTYFDTAFFYATNDYQKADIYLKMGTMYLDCVADDKGELKYRTEVFKRSTTCFSRSIELSENPAKIATCYLRMGLDYHLLKDFKAADEYYGKAENVLIENDSILYLSEYTILQNWRGWNYESWFDATDNPEFLFFANHCFKKCLDSWKVYYTKNSNETKGLQDGYQISPLQWLVSNSIDLFELTADSVYLYNAFEYADQTKYQTDQSNKITLTELQNEIDVGTAFVHYTTLARDNKHIVFIITQNDFAYTTIHKSFTALNTEFQATMYQFLDIDDFKNRSFLFYNSYFKQVDSILTLKNISSVIISNSDMYSMLNLDVLISDTSGTAWKDLSYLFHRYNFSYALSAKSFVAASKKNHHQTNLFGVTIGEYTDQTNLRFSKKLTERLDNNYIIDRSNLFDNLSNHSVSLVLSHGMSDYSSHNGMVILNTKDTMSVSDIYSMNLKNDLIIFTACNTNASQQYNGEGAVGNFTKAFLYAGAKSTLTTSWSIDDKANAFIIEQFIANLSNGISKNDALWKAKKTYWKNCVSDEEYRPLYWAPYILTGNIKPVKIYKREPINYSWLWSLIVIPIGFLVWKKLT